jgi:gamma-glutamyl-gamma-aminobutyrate hydrolase PuuD
VPEQVSPLAEGSPPAATGCIPGGPDIHPRLNGHEAHTMPGPTEMERDPVELALVDRLGEGLEAVAWAPDGVVEPIAAERRARAVAGPVA